MNDEGLAFYQPWILMALVLVPIVLVAQLWLARCRRHAVEAITGGGRSDRRVRGATWLCLATWAASLVLLIVASAGPTWGREYQTPLARGRDLVVVLDVSRSMLAEDVPPLSRLDRSRDALGRMVDAAQQLGGYRLGLVVFAGNGQVLCPLTDDYDHFRFALQLAHPDHLGSNKRLRQRGRGPAVGTDVASGIAAASELHDERFRGFQDILLISDGEDLGGARQTAVARCVEAGIPIHTVAVGDAIKGAPVPSGVDDPPYLVTVDAEGRARRVISRRQDAILDQIARQTNGSFQVLEEEGTMAAWFQREIVPLPDREWTEDRRPILVHRSASFFAAALGLLFIGHVLAAKWGRQTSRTLEPW